MTDSSSRPRVAVVFGGRSAEHAISCISARSVLAAIDRDTYDVVPVGITREGRWVLAGDDGGALAVTDGALPTVDGSAPPVTLAGAHPGSGALVAPGTGTLMVTEPGEVPRELGSVDVVFPVLHGAYGEDGTVQGLLEMTGVRYVGSGVLSSALAMDKVHMKAALASAGLTVGRYVAVAPRRWEQAPDAVRAEVAALGWPVFVKPARAGSSFGITKVRGAEGLGAAIELAREHDPKVLVEAAVVGREIECGVLEDEDGNLRASVPAEIRVRPGHEFYDFAAKYLEDTDFDVPADLPGSVVAAVQSAACRSFEALSCEGLARVDFFLTPSGEVVVNEVNTMPGFTPVSMFPRMWAATGVDYPELVDRLVRAALSRSTGLR